MTASIKSSIGTLLLVFCLTTAGAQSVHLLGFQPTIGVEGQLNKRWDYFFQLSGEGQFNEERVGGDVFENGTRNIDFQVGASTDLTADWNGSANFTFRLREPFAGAVTTELRTTQQVTWSKSFSKYRFRHRVRADERFVQRRVGAKYEFNLRIRYRFSLDFPLQGDRLDVKEFYLNSNAEILYTPTEDDAFFYREYRGYGAVGYLFDERYRFEMGGAYETARIDRELGRENNWQLRMVWAIFL